MSVKAWTRIHPKSGLLEGARAPQPDSPTSWALPAPEGADAAVTCWNGIEAWFDTVLDILNTADGDHERRTAADRPVSHKTLCRVALADAKAADRVTGRGVTTANETVAARLGVSSKTVSRCRIVLERLGLSVTIVPGRYLTVDERIEAFELHGGVQLKAASRRNLTQPKASPVNTGVHLSRRDRTLKISSGIKYLTTNAPVRKSVATLPQSSTNEEIKCRRRASPSRGAGVHSPEMKMFAAKVAVKFPGLLRGRHYGALCDVLSDAGITPERWRAEPLYDVLNQRAGKFPELRAKQNPLGYFGWILKNLIDPTEHTPVDLERIAAQNRIDEQAARAAENEEQQRRLAADDPAETARILAQMRADMAADRWRCRHLETSRR